MASKDPQNTGQSGRTKSPKAPASKDRKEQSERFKKTARELDADETGEAFEIAVRTILIPKGRKNPGQ